MKTAEWKTVTLKPFTGFLDNRSSPSEVPLGAHRTKQNFMIAGTNKLCRRAGHDRLFSTNRADLNHAEGDEDYNPVYTNWDYHDQRSASGEVVREAVTMLFEVFRNSGPRYLYLGTQSKVKRLNQDTGIWTDVTANLTGLGGATEDGVAQTRFKAAELQNTLILVNNVDRVLYHDITSNTTQEIPELKSVGTGSLNVGKAAVVASFKGFILIMNLEEDGVRVPSRVRWSDLNRPLVWVPETDTNLPAPPDGDQNSLADYQDLDYDEEILAAAEMAGSLYVYTTRSIWRASIGTSQAFSFFKVYSEPKNSAKCLFFANTLVSTGNENWYAGADGIYRFTPFIPEPERVEWLYRGTMAIFADDGYAGDDGYCASPVAQAYPLTREIHISWPESGGAVPGQNTKTLVFNHEYKSVDLVDTGYTAFVNFRPNLEDGGNCRTRAEFIAASSDDWCLKDIGAIYSRQRCTNAATGDGTDVEATYNPFVGTYATDGYYSILKGMLPFQNYDVEKAINHLLIEVKSVTQATPCVVRLRVGATYSEADTNEEDGRCSVLWRRAEDKELACQGQMTASEYIAANLKPDLGTEWEVYEEGRFLYYEIVIANADGTPAVGGSACFSRMEASVQLLPA